MKGNFKDVNLANAYRMLHARGETTSSLAAKLGTSRAYVSRMLSGEQRAGDRWKELCALLEPREIALLEQVTFTGQRWSFNNLRRPRAPRHGIANP